MAVNRGDANPAPTFFLNFELLPFNLKDIRVTHIFDYKMKQCWKKNAGAEKCFLPHICSSHIPSSFCFSFVQSLSHISTNFWLSELSATAASTIALSMHPPPEPIWTLTAELNPWVWQYQNQTEPSLSFISLAKIIAESWPCWKCPLGFPKGSQETRTSFPLWQWLVRKWTQMGEHPASISRKMQEEMNQSKGMEPLLSVTAN